MKTRFDLEQQIFQCWNIVGDIKDLLEGWEELDEDDKLNILIGLKSLYGLKFENCFNTFEELVTKGRL